jgi:hypothetical protein
MEKNQLSVLSDFGRVQGGTDRLWRMVLTPWRSMIIQSENTMDRKSWICSRSTLRYCPICLSRDQEPYLRLLWRLQFLPVCIYHHVVLQRIHTRSENTLLTERRNFSNVPLVHPIYCDRLVQFTSSLPTILESGKLPEDRGWPYSAQDFFNVLLTLVRYLNLYSQREPSWIESLQAHALPSEPPFEWRENDSVASLLIEEALGLVEDWPTNILAFVRENESRFRRLRAEYGERSPRALNDIIAKEHLTNHCCSSDKNHDLGYEARRNCSPRVRSRQERVKDAVEYLLKTNAPVSMREVCRVARVGFQCLKSDGALNEIVQKGKAKFRLKQETEVQDAVKVLRARGLPVSLAAVATYIGKSHRYLKKGNFRFKLGC